MTVPEDRCRLVLIVPDIADVDKQAKVVADALRGGDVASVILPQYGLDDSTFQKHAEKLVPLVQEAGAAALIAGDSRVAGRAKADGLHITGNLAEFTEAVEKHVPKLIVGGGNATDRHHALEIGELRPDYIFFGKLDGDIKPEAHPKNVALGEWWASMIAIPCIVMGGTDPKSALEVALSGAEFVALRTAVFADPAAAASIVAEVNALLDEKAPRFED
ncbi:thiamine phosphate synthase [Rhizobium rhizogenes]|uniref:thiamine phosphate synthase n=1 Tax=Rhizobium rhizogenes TaxID=359 RepID=UPI001573B5A9|nr:thiamine phosphate synthase [Rhizobium rhizogenes]NTG08490.1 thiamine phosphate synthase [Rhizobium rhizogenes]NTI35849.1 thiamine phosphate synthase [Rhizobium rhizogenes]WEO63817.1 thiamine phosphate synthase [Rhizobium rhizogenes]